MIKRIRSLFNGFENDSRRYFNKLNKTKLPAANDANSLTSPWYILDKCNEYWPRVSGVKTAETLLKTAEAVSDVWQKQLGDNDGSSAHVHSYLETIGFQILMKAGQEL